MFWLKKWQRKKIISRNFPQDWIDIVEKNVPLYRILPREDKQELQNHIKIFMAEKLFEGCGGLAITDEIKVTIAAHACILLLHRQTDYYPGLYTILVYPEAYVATQIEYLEGGVVIERPDVRLGESWHRGTVVLSWDDVRKSSSDAHDGQNVVLHEFAHQLDSSAGKGDSSEILHCHKCFTTWARILQKDYEKLCHDVRNNHQTLLNGYGATNPAEFFAVATEIFFEKSADLRIQHPELYDELKRFYHQDPAALHNR